MKDFKKKKEQLGKNAKVAAVFLAGMVFMLILTNVF